MKVMSLKMCKGFNTHNREFEGKLDDKRPFSIIIKEDQGEFVIDGVTQFTFDPEEYPAVKDYYGLLNGNSFPHAYAAITKDCDKLMIKLQEVT